MLLCLMIPAAHHLPVFDRANEFLGLTIASCTYSLLHYQRGRQLLAGRDNVGRLTPSLIQQLDPASPGRGNGLGRLMKG